MADEEKQLPEANEEVFQLDIESFDNHRKGLISLCLNRKSLICH